MFDSFHNLARFLIASTFVFMSINYQAAVANQDSAQLKELDRVYSVEVDNQKSQFEENKISTGRMRPMLSLPDLPDLCNPAPIPTKPQGPKITRNYSRFGDNFKLIAWRYPCNEDYSFVIMTIEPEPEVFICSSQVTLVQDGIQNDDFKLVQDPINDDSSHCGDVYIATSFAIEYWSFATRNIDLQASFEIYWDLGNNTQHFTMFAYNPSDYGIGGEPPPAELSNDVGVNGLFFDPNNSGHGFDIIRHEGGLVIYYYGHSASGERLWLISDNYQGNLDYKQEFRIDMYEISEGTFGSPTLPASKWGSIYMEFDTCDSGQATLNGEDGVVQIDFVRLVGIPGLGCE